MSDQLPGTDQIDVLWTALTEEHERIYRELRSAVLRRIDEACKQQINAGNYDPSVELAGVFDWFFDEFLQDDSEFVTEVLESDTVFMETIEYDREQLGHLVFDRLIADLEDDDELLYIYDRQRVRSRVAELARYFALIRQRLDTDEWSDYGFAPNLVKMVKMDILDREQPIIDPERASKFGPTLRRINRETSGDDVTPAVELEERLGNDWRAAVSETVEFMGMFFEEGLPEQFAAMADYQADAFVELYVDAVTETRGSDVETNDAHVITASTGGGKTEAFLFPTLAYCHTAWQADIEGNKATLTYPRQDLCNNQFQRLLKYVFAMNEQLDAADAGFEDAPITIGLQHGNREELEPECPFCDDGTTMENTGYDEGEYFVCTEHDEHKLEWATTDRSKPADIIVTTQNSLHVRLMDRYGKDAFWSSPYPTKFLVLDEVHVYTEQSGMHVSNVVRRFKRALENRNNQQTPSLVASSATIHEAENFTARIFDTREEDVALIQPAEDETETTGSEYMIFVKATDPRDAEIPVGDSVFKPREEWGTEMERTTASNLSCMIQIAFAFYHTMRKEGAGDRPELEVDKDRILGFVDSIDSVGRLGSDVEDAEWNRRLFELRRPDAIIRGNANPDCPMETFQNGTDDEFEETAVCEHVVPNEHLNECSVYEAGECWWTMRDRELDLQPMRMAIHKSGNRQLPPGSNRRDDPNEVWDQLIATSALEVGFDHPSIIGTFQYRAPMSVPGFIQRKGRGGRDIEDKPVTVVVLGSTSTDSFYFHHSEYLSRPRDEHLEIPLDENNRFVRAEHMTAAIFDYFNVQDRSNAERIYRGTGTGMKGPDVDYLQRELDAERDNIREWLKTGFDEDEASVEQVLAKLETYLETLEEPLVPEKDNRPFWQAFREVIDETGTSGASEHIDELARQLRRTH